MKKTIKYNGPLRGTLLLPGDKSISHRAAMLLSIAAGKSTITNYATGDDCRSTLDCLKQLGVSVGCNGSEVEITGVGRNSLERPSGALNCGNSGTTMRLLSGILAGSGFDSTLTGDESLCSRPMKRVVEPLELMGARIETSDGLAPLLIKSTDKLGAATYKLPVASAQVKSCVLFAGLYAGGPVTVIGPASVFKRSASRDHSERMLDYLGAKIEESYLDSNGLFEQVLTIYQSDELVARDIDVPADVSTAAFFLVAAAGLKGSDITLEGVGLNPTRVSIIDVLKECGIRIAVTNIREKSGEPRGDVRVSWDGDCELIQEVLVISGDKIAGLIDEVPVLAVLGTLLPGGLEIRDAAELRIKESDRIDAIVRNLKKMGADIVEFEDGFRVKKSMLKGAEIESYGDHRIAMAFAVAGLFAEGSTTINDADCVSVSYPAFFEELGRLGKTGD